MIPSRMLETQTKTAYFKVMLPKHNSKLRVAIMASSTPEYYGQCHQKTRSLETKFKETIPSTPLRP
jgi:hypothetical protein